MLLNAANTFWAFAFCHLLSTQMGIGYAKTVLTIQPLCQKATAHSFFTPICLDKFNS